jgi:hypothetical protein
LEALSHHAVFLISVEARRQLIAEIIMLPKNFYQTLIENLMGIFELVREEGIDAWVDSWVDLCGGVSWPISRGMGGLRSLNLGEMRRSNF